MTACQREYGRNMQIFGQAYIVCRETEKGQDFVREYVYDRVTGKAFATCWTC